MRFARAALNEIMNDQMEIEKLKEKNKSLKKVQIKSVKNDIAFTDVNFSYPGHQKVILDNLNMRIKIGSSIAIVGATGAGKSTIIDILLGLITPSSGEINIDGEKLTEGNIDSWLDKIGYVSQSIFLKDDSVAANIAFGQLPDEMDLDTVEKAARLACIDDFIRNDLPSGYHTNVGERGVKLSGGQCQRISIARALYRDPKVLIFDEATSALDKRTEKKIVENIRAQQSGCTIIMVAHRFSTIEHCDTIFLMDEGRLIAQGSYKNLLDKNETFKKLAGSAPSTVTL
jgi:ABC-type multidrug transport system fused ATPase/permease subunit